MRLDMESILACTLLALFVAGATGYTPNRPPQSLTESPLRELHAWKKADYLYQDEDLRTEHTQTGNYIPENSVFIDVDAFVGRDGVRRLFVTTPSVMPGIPFSLSIVTNFKGEGGSSRLKPFPNEHWHHRSDCSKIISAFRIKIDRLGRLWVLDNGKVEAFTNPTKLCDPKLLAFDLKNDGVLINQYTIPDLDPKSLPISLDVEVRDDHDDTYVYVTDPVTYTMVVYSMAKNTSHTVKHPYFFPDPMYGLYNLNGVNFTLMDGLFDVVVGDPRTRHGKKDGTSEVYFHSLSAGRQGSIKSDVLTDPELSKNPLLFRMSTFQRKNHVSVAAMHKGRTMVFPDLESNSLVAWDTTLPYAPENFKVLARDTVRLQFPSGLKVIGNEVYILTSRIQNVMVGKIPKDEINYRLLVGNINKLLENGKFNYTDGYRT